MERTPPRAQRALTALANRIAVARGLRFAVEALAIAACAIGVALLGARLLGVAVDLDRTEMAWLAALAFGLPLIGGFLLAYLRRPAAEHCAVWLDRELGLGGILLTAYERDLADWHVGLEARVASVAVRAPGAFSPQFRRALGRTGLALAFLLGIAALPAVSPKTPLTNPLVASTIENLKQQLEEAVKAEAIERKSEQDLKARLEKLEERSREGEPVPWSDLDDVGDELDRAQNERQAELAKASSELSALAGESKAAAELGDAAEAAANEELARALEEIAKSGLLDAALSGLDPATAEELRKLAEAAKAGGLSPEKLTAEQRAALADAAQKLAQGLDSKLASAIDPKLAKELGQSAAAKKLAQAGKSSGKKASHKHTSKCSNGQCNGGQNGDGSNPVGDEDGSAPDELGEATAGTAGTSGEGDADMTGSTDQAGVASGQSVIGSAPGKGGVSRGPGDADLEYSNSSQGDAFKSEMLPKGSRISREWTVVGIGRSAPRDGNVTIEGGDTAQNAGESGQGRAAWQRRLAPSHREAVKKFFDGKK